MHGERAAFGPPPLTGVPHNDRPDPVPVSESTVAILVISAATCAGEIADRDCAPSEVRADVDGRPLTREEKIARLDEALRESLARFDECQAADSASAGAGSGAQGAPGDATSDGGGASGRSVATEGDGGAEAAQTGGAMESVAAEGVQGTETPEEGAGTVPGAERPTASGGLRSDTSAGIPDDIPEPDNDSVLEAQIRRAAMEETDPRIRAELWNEYRKYKGLPARPLPDENGEPSDAELSE